MDVNNKYQINYTLEKQCCMDVNNKYQINYTLEKQCCMDVNNKYQHQLYFRETMLYGCKQ